MRRREVIALLGGAAAAWPLAAGAQQPTLPVIGFLNVESAKGYARPLAAFVKGLGEAGYVEGRNVAIEYRWAEGHSERLPELAADLVRKQVNVIAATSTPASIAARAATTTIPIVFETASDPVRIGLVGSLSRPGGNITGVTQTNVEVAPKRLEVIHELLPKATVLGLLINPADPSLAEPQMKDFQAAAKALGVELHIVNARNDDELEKVFADLSQMHVGGLVISTDPFFTSRPEKLAGLTARYAIPAISKGREFAAAGGLLSYGADTLDTYRFDLDLKGIRSKQRILTSGRVLGGCCFDRGALYHLLRNRIYRGEVMHKGVAYPGEHKPIVGEELWSAVQARLSANLTGRRQARIASGALLAGVIFDDRGHRMSPTYTVRRRSRYRYYVSQAHLRGGEPGSRPRIGADEVEQLVVQELCRQQGGNNQITDVATGSWTADIRELVRTTIDRIVIHHDGIEIALKRNAINRASGFVDGDTQNEGPRTVRLALPPPCPRARKEIIVPGNSGTRPRRIDHELIRALARARSWMGMLQQGEYADTAEIAQRHGLSEPHVRRLLRFAYLAPDIVEAIVEGRQPRTLTVKLLLQGIPLDWSDQHAAFGLR